MSVRDRRYAVERARREEIGHDRQDVPGAEIGEGPGTVVRRAPGGGVGASENYRADHGYQAISLHPRLVMRCMCTKEGAEL